MKTRRTPGVGSKLIEALVPLRIFAGIKKQVRRTRRILRK
jgi:hypothetical protein